MRTWAVSFSGLLSRSAVGMGEEGLGVRRLGRFGRWWLLLWCSASCAVSDVMMLQRSQAGGELGCVVVRGCR